MVWFCIYLIFDGIKCSNHLTNIFRIGLWVGGIVDWKSIVSFLLLVGDDFRHGE